MKYEVFVLTRVFVDSKTPDPATVDFLAGGSPIDTDQGVAETVDVKTVHIRRLPDDTTVEDLV